MRFFIKEKPKNMDSPSHTHQKASFGRHETFALRYAWLTKGFQALQHNAKIFNTDAATIELGVGKNMVHAIKYWLRAAQMIDHEQHITDVGKLIFSEQGDQYLQDEATIWLIHWLIATNFEAATAWYWFFNGFHKTEFTSEEAADALVAFSKNFGKHSERTVRHEISMILRMYTPSINKTQIEDSLDAPLISLNLIHEVENTRFYRSPLGTQNSLPVDIVGYAVNEVFGKPKVLPIHDLMHGQKHSIALGSVFRLTENALLAKLENLVQRYPNDFQLNETAGLHQLHKLTNKASIDFLNEYYG